MGDQMEAEMSSLHEYLTQDGMPGIKESLIDEQGFPRADLDIYAIRKARNRLAGLQTDHMELMKKLEQALFDIHASSRVAVPRQDAVAKPASDVDMGAGGAPIQQVLLPPAPFALIDEV